MIILFKPWLDVTDKNGRYILTEAIFDKTKIILLDINAPNNQTHQVNFLRDCSHTIMNQYVNEHVVLGGDFNCALNTIDKQGGRSFEHKKVDIKELNTLLTMHNLVGTWRQRNPNVPGFTWSNPPMKIQCRLHYFFLLRSLQSLIADVKMVANIFSDHSALCLSVHTEEQQTKTGPGFWKSKNSLLMDSTYVELITQSIPEFVTKYLEFEDEGLFWKMIKMDIRVTTIIFTRRKTKQKSRRKLC